MLDKQTIILHKPGLVDYKEAWEMQKSYFTKNFEIKTGKKEGETSCHLFLLEHPHVYTLGNSGNKNNLLLSKPLLKLKKAAFYKVERGGDITYHGPGQLVGYPVFDLDKLNLSIKDFVFNIEEMLIRTVAHYGIVAERLEGATGVWLDSDSPQKARKIAAIGMKISKKVSMHGFALNVNTNLDYFGYIIPCGLQDKGVTSIQKELGKTIPMEETEAVLTETFEKVFGTKLTP
ncbi:MAG: lipoate--protein ligase [Bacteroidetes bacterium]|nr:MAG: lipoate--protein ligase [Bacteroidota bacterium]